MRLRTWAIATAAVVAASLFFAWFLDISVERALLLAPVFVISFGLVAGLALVFWRAAMQSLRRN
jgi:Na+/proline symporter